MHVQLQPDRSPALDTSAAVATLSSLDDSASVSEGEDSGHYVNIDFTPADAKVLWQKIHGCLSSEPELARIAIVACEGRHGWDDYLLLYHYDRTLVLDEL